MRQWRQSKHSDQRRAFVVDQAATALKNITASQPASQRAHNLFKLPSYLYTDFCTAEITCTGQEIRRAPHSTGEEAEAKEAPVALAPKSLD